MVFIAGSTATLRHRLIGVLSATGLGGAVIVALIAPSATAAPDPCSASEMARTVGRSPSQRAITWTGTRRPTRR